jgi:alpha-D-xyloside xylohydrolase
MNTHLLDTNDVLRASVQSAELLEAGPAHLLLKTVAKVQAKRAVSSADSEMLNRQKLAGVGDTVEGRVRIDVLGDTVLRVRYAEGAAVPENATPMVVGAPPPPTRCEIDPDGQPMHLDLDLAPWLKQAGAAPADRRTVVIRTAGLRVAVCLNPYRIEVYDATGRRALCGVGGPEKDNFCNWDTLGTGVCRARTDGAPLAVENFDLAHDECVYGLGERFVKLNKVGQTIDLNMVDALGVTTQRGYKNIPFYLTTKGYGVFFNHSSLMTVWVGSKSAADVQVAAEDDFLDYYLLFGSIRDLLASYSEITGRGALPPPWTFGYWQSKISYKAADETLEIAREMRRHEIPCDVIHLDTFWFKEDWYCDLRFAEDRFPDPKAYLAELAALGIKVSLWQLPYIPEGSRLFAELKAVDGFVKNKEGGIYNCGICFTPGFKGIVGVVDYTNPAAVRVHQAAFRDLFRLGAKVIKTDFGEAAPLDGVYFDGTPGHRMHNLYPLLYNRALFEVTREETGDGVVWARSAWAGNQRYPLHWGGDNSPNWFNMVPQLEGGLSFGLSGFQFWSQDIGGFCGTVNEALLIRWLQLGMFLSHSRIHGFGHRELYKFAPDTMRICRDYIRLRYQLMPYIYGSAARCVRDSLPMARALVVDFQDDPNTWNLGDEYLFGDSLLVAPVCDPTGHRRVYLPAGTWTDWWTGRRLRGGRWLLVKADVETLPLYVREGGLIPMGPVMNYIGEKPVDRITLRLAPFSRDGASSFQVPVNGQWVPVHYRAEKRRHRVSIGRCDVPFDLEVLGRATVEISREA